MIRSASAVWSGDFKTGEGRMSTGNRLLSDAPYSYRSRFEEGEGTNPEEMIAAAHASCFSMALTASLEKEGFAPTNVSTTADIKMEPVDGAPTLVKSTLKTVVTVPNIENDRFQEIAAGAKANCPISRVLKLEIELDAQLA